RGVDAVVGNPREVGCSSTRKPASAARTDPVSNTTVVGSRCAPTRPCPLPERPGGPILHTTRRAAPRRRACRRYPETREAILERIARIPAAAARARRVVRSGWGVGILPG